MAPPKLAALTTKPQSLDIAALSQMVEPLTFQVDKVKNGQRSPIPLPAGEGYTIPGTGWSKEDVQTANEGWLVNHWTGGGIYVLKVTDSSVPPVTLEWRSFWNVADYPEKIPPTLAGSANPQRIQQLQQTQAQPSQQATQPTMTAFPGGLPTGGLMVPSQGLGWSQPQQQYAQPAYYPPQMMPAPAYNPEADRLRRLEEQLAATNAQLAKALGDAAQAKYQADLERERAANQAATQRLEQRLTEMAQAQAHPKTDAAIEAQREANRMLEAKLENERREREAERREREMRDMITQMNANTQRQIEALQAQYQQQLASMNNRGQDPWMQMLAEQNRNFIASLGEISRQQTSQLDKFQSFMMSPRDIIALQKDGSQGLDQITNKLTGVFTNVVDMQQKVMESALQLNQGGSETVALVREGITSAKEAFERYIGNRGKTEQVSKQAEAQAVTAQAQAAAINAQAQVEIARIQNMPAPIQQQIPTTQRQAASVPQPGPGLNGTPTNGNAFAEWQRQRQSAQQADANAARPQPTPSGQATLPYPTGEKRLGRTDDEWFGQFVGEVYQLRAGVEMFLQGVRRGTTEEGASPSIVTDGICQAQAMATAGGIPLPAIIELLNQSKYDEFLEVLLPKAPDTFKEDVVKMLRERLDGDVTDDGDDDTDEDEDDGDNGNDDGEHTDDVKDGSTAKIRVVQKPKQQPRA